MRGQHCDFHPDKAVHSKGTRADCQLKTPACHYTPGPIRTRAAWSLRCWNRHLPSPCQVWRRTRLGTRRAPVHIVCGMVFSLSSDHKCFLFKGKFQRSGGCPQWKDDHWVSTWPGNRSECGLMPSSNNPVLDLSVGGLCFFLKLRWLLLPEP